MDHYRCRHRDCCHVPLSHPWLLSLCLPRDTLVTLVYTPSNWTIYASAFAFLCNNFGLVIIWYRGCKTRATWWDMQCTTDPVMFNRDSTVFYELQALRCTPLRTKKNKKKQSGQRGGWTRDQNRVEAVMTTCWALTAAHCPLMGGLGGVAKWRPPGLGLIPQTLSSPPGPLHGLMPQDLHSSGFETGLFFFSSLLVGVGRGGGEEGGTQPFLMRPWCHEPAGGHSSSLL